MMVRTKKVSMRIPAAIPKPTCWISPEDGDPPEATPSTAKVPPRTRPAVVTVVPVTPMAVLTASRRGSPCNSSRILVITSTL